jgi:predicted alpha/beta hydrolase
LGDAMSGAGRADVARTPVRIPAGDGYPLAASLFEAAAAEPRAVVIVNAATGAPARFYGRYAKYLAGHGFAVVTWDYRGTAASRPTRLRGFEASITDWGTLDVAGVIEWAAARHSGRPIHIVGHSIGGVLPGLAPNNHRLAGLITVGAQLAYWPDYKSSHRLAMLALWHGLMPLAAAVCGYFPGRALRLGEDLPKGVVREWTEARRKRGLRRELLEGRPLPGAFANFDTLTAPVLAYSFTDDVFATLPAVERHFALLRATTPLHRRRTPAELAVAKVGHFGFFLESFREPLWAESVDWLLRAGA